MAYCLNITGTEAITDNGNMVAADDILRDAGAAVVTALIAAGLTPSSAWFSGPSTGVVDLLFSEAAVTSDSTVVDDAAPAEE